jgi:hypothetical protein
MSDWGILPDQALNKLRLSFWANRPAFKALLKGERSFPLTLNLKPPTGKQARDNIAYLQQFIRAWEIFKEPKSVLYETREFKELSTQRLPVKLQIDDMQSLAACLGEPEIQELSHLHQRMANLLAEPFVPDDKKEPLFNCLVYYLDALQSMTENELNNLCQLIPQLTQGMGKGQYLRALPVKHVDTKFIENNLSLIEAILNVLKNNLASPLMKWLDCKSNPKGWLWIRPLCTESQEKLAGLSLLQMDSQTLIDHPLPAKHILVVENVQSGLGLPELPGTIAVFGGGKNVSWLNQKQVAYFGDIDSEGLAILADARAKHSAISPLMMNKATLNAYAERMVTAKAYNKRPPVNLSNNEQALFGLLEQGINGKNRLEQERLPQDFIKTQLLDWINGKIKN